MRNKLKSSTLQDDIDELNRSWDDFFLEVRNGFWISKKRFYRFKDGVYIKIKHSLGIKELQKLPGWFFYTIHFLFMPVWTMRSIKENMK